MSDDSKRVDQYIKKAPDFAKPILEKIRKVVHKGCPDIEEAIKWGIPNFMYRGSILCSMAFFKKHVGFGFWQSKQMSDPEKLFETGTGKKASMCNAHFHSIKEVPTQQVLLKYIREAKKLKDDDVKKSKTSKKKLTRKKIAVPKLPSDVAKAFGKSKKAKTYFDSLAPSHRRDYLEWVLGAKREATREKRIKEMIVLLKDNKHLHWKYERKK